jgi:hypothetical protein
MANLHRYIATDQYLHWLSQIIVRANIAYVPEKPDDSHSNLGFYPAKNSIEGRWIQVKDNSVLVALNLTDQSFEILDSKRNLLTMWKKRSALVLNILSFKEMICRS